jgi:hypothetical protein
VLAVAFRGWREEVQLQLYRRHVVVVLNHKINNGVLLKAFNCWRCAWISWGTHQLGSCNQAAIRPHHRLLPPLLLLPVQTII